MGLPKISDQTLRQVARLSLGGQRLRIVISNEYGKDPLRVAAAHLGRTAPGGAIAPQTDRRVTFSGAFSVVVPPGARLVSDPVDLPTPALSEVSVSLYFPGEAPATTFHWDGKQTAYIGSGDVAARAAFTPAATTLSRLFLSDILVERAVDSDAVLVLGDSITDGASATVDANRRWTDYLAERLAPRNVAVVNAGISGARVLKSRMGVSALERFDRDILAQPHVRAVVVLIGINDISWPGSAFEPDAPATAAEELIAGYRQLIQRARLKGLRIVGATLSPFRGALEGTPLWGYYSPEKDRTRQAVNQWIRTSGEFDGVIDFDAALRDPADPSRLRANVDSGDHLHPGDAGNKAMSDMVDLAVLLGPQPAGRR
ncbi:SGNH/GDSL hydrolase family protein [Phenylobacterium sp.]|jgi:lysophospholipase L1-like esterase|uniref:SGNH/GDSL hydrolase family protein n=1 Tax=Phenylobacterium sp. TaxID=1871053 RepID=UPI002E372020|nr:SGNH/GDSL hydrolase family protein [Phenylobacterium sp.]HEX4709012.1 SGNH/GDSL hydrolase family protein [Phenylobacterium sp.]